MFGSNNALQYEVKTIMKFWNRFSTEFPVNVCYSNHWVSLELWTLVEFEVCLYYFLPKLNLKLWSYSCSAICHKNIVSSFISSKHGFEISKVFQNYSQIFLKISERKALILCYQINHLIILDLSVDSQIFEDRCGGVSLMYTLAPVFPLLSV